MKNASMLIYPFVSHAVFISPILSLLYSYDCVPYVKLSVAALLCIIHILEIFHGMINFEE